jgi:hypothetical protein
MADKYILLTNLRDISITCGNKRIFVHAKALLLTEIGEVQDNWESRYTLRGFGTSCFADLFQMPLASIAYVLSHRPGSSTMTMRFGAIEDFELRLGLSNPNKSLDVEEFSEYGQDAAILGVWRKLRDKVYLYWPEGQEIPVHAMTTPNR